jgi:HlyD family secretion protein
MMDKRKIFKRIIVLAAAGLIIVAVVRMRLPFGKTEMEDLNLGIPTRVMQVERKDLVSTVRYSGTVEGSGSVTLIPKVTATIRNILVEEGDRVVMGDVLITLDDRHLQAAEEGFSQKMEGLRTTIRFLNQSIDTFQTTNPQVQKLESARSRYTYLEGEVEKMGILFEHGAIARDTFETIQLEKEAAGYQVQELEAVVSSAVDQLTHERNMISIQLKELDAMEEEMGLNLQETQVIAPLTGTVRQIFYQQHDLYRTGTALVIIDDNSDYVVKVNVGEVDAARIRLEDPVLVTLRGIDGQLMGRVTKTPGYLQPVTRTGEVEITLERSDIAVLMTGASATADFIHQRAEGLVIPSSAIKQLGHRQLVYVVQGDTVQERNIRTGLSAQNETLVIEGLEEFENIAVQNLNQLYHGAKVFVFEGVGGQ